MGVFDLFKNNGKRKQSRKDRKKFAETRSIISEYYGGDYDMFLWSYARSIEKIPEVRIAINTVAEYFSTMPIYHKVISDKGTIQKITKGSDDINYVLGYKPNVLQNSIQFWQSCVTQLLLENNIFIEPEYGSDGRLEQLYLLPYKEFQFSLENKKAYVTFLEEKPQKKHNMRNLIYISRFCNLAGGKKNDLGLYEQVIQAMNTQILNYCNPKKVKALMTGKMMGGQLKQADKKGATEELKLNFANNVEGVAYMDDKWEITPINWNENDVNKELKEAVINTVYNYFGISDKIINHTATEYELELFIAQTIKPLADQFEKELTTKLFSTREFDVGHRVEFDVFALSIATLQAKTSFFSVASRNGLANIDEMRSMIGLAPIPDGQGQKYRASADCVDIKYIDDYQLGKIGKEKDSNSTDKVDDIENNKEESDAKENKQE